MCVVIPFILDVRLVDAPAGVTQEGKITHDFFHLPSAVLVQSHEMGFVLTKKKKIMPTKKWRMINSWVHNNIQFHGRRGKGTAESFSRQKLRQAPQKESGEILCDPGWCVHKSDVQK